MSLNIRVLIVEDEPLLAMDLEAALRNAGAHPYCANSFQDALQHIEQRQFDVCIADLQLWGQSADLLIQALKKSNVPFLTYSGYFDPPTGRVIAHVQKPRGADAVVEELKRRFA